MTYTKFHDKWSRNINSEYIIPDIESLNENNYIIPKCTWDIVPLRVKNLTKEDIQENISKLRVKLREQENLLQDLKDE